MMENNLVLQGNPRTDHSFDMSQGKVMMVSQ